MEPYQDHAHHRAHQAENRPFYIYNSTTCADRPAIPAQLSYLDL